MFIYNVTLKVQDAIKDEWLNWLKEEHLPEVLGTGCFSGATILQILELDNTEGPTYAIQYRAESKALYNRYIEQFADDMRQRSYEKWGDRFIAFRTLMQVVH
ncbi:MAG: DUF4286 family protein [Chitinophagaceae bacterium]|nr:DUF4286 family protein [Chitinophagaceae bacterium]MBL0055519.1 DUF4286 family protein [Chitinophagaceae bacterium]